MLKRISLAILVFLLLLSAVVACDNADIGVTETTDSVTEPRNEEQQTTAPVTDAGDEGLDEALYGWFDFGGALYLRDRFEVGSLDTIAISMAKNEIEGFQYVMASGVEHNDLRCEISTLTDGNGNTLTGTVYVVKNIYVNKADAVHYRGYTPEVLVEQDHAYWGGSFDLKPNQAQTIYVQYKTDADTVPGTYTGKLEIRSGDTVVCGGEVSVTVWNIYYDEKTECISNVGCWAMAPGTPLEDYLPEGVPVLDISLNPEMYLTYYDFLLENRLSGPWLPFEDGVMDEQAEAYLNNPRVKLLSIGIDSPIFKKYLPQTIYAKAEAEEWLNKLCITTYDEPSEQHWVDHIVYKANQINVIFPTKPHLNPFCVNVGKDGKNILEQFAEISTLHCPHVDMVEGEILETIKTLKARGDTMLWYTCYNDSANTINVLACTPGTEKRQLFWQQYQHDIDGFLYWSAVYWQNVGNIWAADYDEQSGFPSTIDPHTTEGVLVYWDYETGMPLGGLGLESIRDGVEDFQLLSMAEALLGREATLPYVERLTTNIHTWTKDPAELMQVRNELAALVEAALTV